MTSALETDDGGSIGGDVAAGAIAGTLATVVMSTVMLGALRAGLLGRQPPRLIADAVLDEVPGRQSEAVHRLGTALVHLGYGAVAGAVHQAVRGVSPPASAGSGLGAGAGAGVWALNYVAIAPAIGLLEAPQRDRPDRPIVMLVAHLVWGAVSAIVGDDIARRISAGVGPRRASSLRPCTPDRRRSATRRRVAFGGR